MKKTVVSLFAGILTLVIIQPAQADILLSDTFNSYTPGNLVGQGGWAQTGTTATTPIQANGTAAVLGTSGQDVYDPLSSIYTMSDGTSLYFGMTINVASAQSAGDYFFNFAPTVGESSLFFGRLFVKSTTGGFLLGYMETSGTGSAVNYGSTVLSLNTSYNLVLSYNDVAGALNDTASLYVNPTDSTEANNTLYIAGDTWTTASAENHNVAEVNLRQGSSSAAPGLSIDNLIVATAFNDIVATAVPEPSTIALAGLGGAACLLAFRRRR